MLTQERLKEVIHYNPDTGIFTWIKATSNRVSAGDRAGWLSGGYVIIGVHGIKTGAHRLAWFYMTGVWPVEIDHKNTIRSDNRWINLRDVDHAVNLQNIRRPHKDSINLLGVSRTKAGRFTAKICINGKQTYIGVFGSQEDAHEAYVNVKRKVHQGCTL